MQEHQLVGIQYLEAVTTLLQRIRGADPIKGLFEAADLQFWWSAPRPTDTMGQLFWIDDSGLPEAAVIVTEWSDRIALDPMFTPDATPDFVAHVIERGLAHANEAGYKAVELEVAENDDVQQTALVSLGLTKTEDGFLESWLHADARPLIGALHQDYRLFSRADRIQHPHYAIDRVGPDVEERFLQTSLYRSDLDLLVLASDDSHAAHGVFWYDPVTATGLVEPMRTQEAHQKRGLARHILTSGIDRLSQAGAERIKIIFDPNNAAASALYLDVGFEPVKKTVVFGGPTSSNNSQ